MARFHPVLLLGAALLPCLSLALGSGLGAQGDAAYATAEDTRAALRRAQEDARRADARGRRLEAEARSATRAAEKTAREAAAIAARIQQAEAGIEAAQARLALIGREQARLEARLAQRREPLVRLTGSLQKMTRRPLALSALRPGSLRDTVYLRAILDSTIPQVQRRTAALRREIDRRKGLERDARQALAVLRRSESDLATRQARLAALETRQRLESRQASGDAAREAERALALAEQARDLDGLVRQLDAAGSLREELAALPGPIMRPPRPEQSEVVAATIPPAQSDAGAGLSGGLQLPVTGRTVAGFGAVGDGGARNTGLSLAPRDGAQVVAPSAGRVAFAGAYRGYGRIVIIEHPGGWTSLVTGLARTDVEVGEELVGGSPLGVAGVDGPVVTLELRRAGEPVNPLDFVG